MGAFAAAWIVGQGIIAFRSVRNQGGPPWPGQMMMASGMYAVLALVATGGQGAQRLATLVAWGVNIAAFIQLFPLATPSQASKGWWAKVTAQCTSPAVILPGAGNCLPCAAAAAWNPGSSGSSLPVQSSSTIKGVTGTGTGQTTVAGGAATGTTPGTSLGNPAAGIGAPVG